MPTDLITRIAAGQGDNAEVLRERIAELEALIREVVESARVGQGLPVTRSRWAVIPAAVWYAARAILRTKETTND